MRLGDRAFRFLSWRVFWKSCVQRSEQKFGNRQTGMSAMYYDGEVLAVFSSDCKVRKRKRRTRVSIHHIITHQLQTELTTSVKSLQE